MAITDWKRKRMTTTGDASKLAPSVRECVTDLLTDALFAKEMAANPPLGREHIWGEAVDYIEICKERGVEIVL